MDDVFQRLPWLTATAAEHSLSLHDHLRVVTLLREYVVGMVALAGLPPTVVIWGSARLTPADPHYLAARETATLLARWGYGILTGGGPGIMEAANCGAQEGGTRSIGLPIQLEREERPNGYLDVAVPFTQFAPRHAAFLAAASAFVIFPGGLGTLHELFEALCAMQTGKLARIPLILYGTTFWSGLLAWLRETLVAAGTIDVNDPELLTLADEPAEVAALITARVHWAEGIQRRPNPTDRVQSVLEEAWS